MRTQEADAAAPRSAAGRRARAAAAGRERPGRRAEPAAQRIAQVYELDSCRLGSSRSARTTGASRVPAHARRGTPGDAGCATRRSSRDFAVRPPLEALHRRRPRPRHADPPRSSRRAALRRSDEIKTALLRAVSHDLRSPLTAIVASAEALASSDLDDEERRELAAGSPRRAHRLGRLIDKLLELSPARGRRGRRRTATGAPSTSCCARPSPRPAWTRRESSSSSTATCRSSKQTRAARASLREPDRERRAPLRRQVRSRYARARAAAGSSSVSSIADPGSPPPNRSASSQPFLRGRERHRRIRARPRDRPRLHRGQRRPRACRVRSRPRCQLRRRTAAAPGGPGMRRPRPRLRRRAADPPCPSHRPARCRLRGRAGRNRATGARPGRNQPARRGDPRSRAARRRRNRHQPIAPTVEPHADPAFSPRSATRTRRSARSKPAPTTTSSSPSARASSSRGLQAACGAWTRARRAGAHRRRTRHRSRRPHRDARRRRDPPHTRSSSDCCERSPGNAAACSPTAAADRGVGPRVHRRHGHPANPHRQPAPQDRSGDGPALHQDGPRGRIPVRRLSRDAVAATPSPCASDKRPGCPPPHLLGLRTMGAAGFEPATSRV